MNRVAATILALATAWTPNAFAQQVPIKPGLWQFDMKLSDEGRSNPLAGHLARMRSQMASMPPAQRQEMEKMLAQMSAGGTEITGDGLRTRQCLTKEDIARYDVLGKKGLDGCTTKSAPVPGGAKLSMQCAQPPMKVDASVKYQSDTAYTFESTAVLRDGEGNQQTQKSSGAGKWLGSDCGKIKPASGKG